MSRILALACLLCSLLYAELPHPYNSLKEVRPFVDQGWYCNTVQLGELIKRYHVKTIIEIGVWIGQSTMDMARKIPHDGKIYAVDHFLGSPEHQPGGSAWQPWLPYLYEQFLSNVIHAKLTHKIIPVRMSSIEASSFLANIRPDLVYIDAGHDTESVYTDLITWYPFVESRGILCGDDWVWDTVRVAVERFANERRLRIDASGNFWRLKKI
jgi:hypothetical protein